MNLAIKAPHIELAPRYVRDPATGVHTRPGFAGLAYSDGDGAEETLLALLESARDLRCGSPELAALANTWPLQAHLSHARANLLRPFAFRPGLRVLELGAGCGGLTRHLAETGAHVVAVEGAPLRARCAAARVRDLPNVAVCCDDLASFACTQPFDVVTLVGVLEYARLFLPVAEPIAACLAAARRLLGQDGVLLVAIENQLGLKYFNGCHEDHVGARFAGIADLYGPGTPVTFGRTELGALLQSAGFSTDWYFAFPDYKLPSVVVAERALARPAFAVGDLLFGEASHDERSELRSFDEPAAWPAVARNGLLADLANAFVVIARTGQGNVLDAKGDWLAHKYASGRLPRFATETRFVVDGDGITVEKCPLYPHASSTDVAPALPLAHRPGKARYVEGRLLARDVADAAARADSLDAVAAAFRPWLDDVLAQAISAPAGTPWHELRVPGAMLDWVPFNVIVDAADRRVPIDQEFVLEGDLPLPWLLMRGVVHTLSRCFGQRALADVRTDAVLDAVVAALGLAPIADWSPYCDLEDRLIADVLLPWPGRPVHGAFAQRLRTPATTTVSAWYRLERAQQEARCAGDARSALQEALAAERAQAAGLAATVESLGTRVQQAHADRERDATRLEVLQAEHLRLREEHAALTANHVRLGDEHAGLTAALDRRDARIAMLEDRVAGTAEAAAVAAREAAGLAAALAAQQAGEAQRSAAQRELIAGLESSFRDALAGLAAGHRDHAAALRGEADAVREELAQLRADHAAVLSALDEERRVHLAALADADRDAGEAATRINEANAAHAHDLRVLDETKRELEATRRHARVLEERAADAALRLAAVETTRWHRAGRVAARLTTRGPGSLARSAERATFVLTRLVYRMLPAGEARRRAKDAFYARFGRWFRNTQNYQVWHMERASAATSDRRAAAEAASGPTPPALARSLSVIVPALGKAAMTRACVDGLRASGLPACTEIIVVDDGSPEPLAPAFADADGVRVLRNEANLGFIGACNRGAAVARGDLLFFLNNDATVSAGAPAAMIEAFADPRVGVVGARLVFPDGRLQEAGAFVRPDGAAEMTGLWDDPARPRYGFARNVGYVSGACLMIEAALFHELGGFDATFAPAYCEDSDLCYRARARGRRVVYEPRATAVHALSATMQDARIDKAAIVARNQRIFLDRWGPTLRTDDRVRALAFYLPQYHPIPENDRWWGPGFTEWTNVARAKPLFAGHVQPTLPADLGFYDLRVPEVRARQAALARAAGIFGFCYYAYWFGGTRLLNAPLDAVVTSGAPDFPFCICWANENWTRRWDGLESEILIAQSHSPEDDVAFFDSLLPALRDPRYVRVDGRAVLLVYRPAMLPDARATAARWRQRAQSAGVGELYLLAVQSFFHVDGRGPAAYGFDGAVEFPPHSLAVAAPAPRRVLGARFDGAVYDYERTRDSFTEREPPDYPLFRTVMPRWDNTPRRGMNANVFAGANPHAYEEWLKRAVTYTRRMYFGDERLLFINAWNEWGEGNYLEPDQQFGHAFLDATRRVLVPQDP